MRRFIHLLLVFGIVLSLCCSIPADASDVKAPTSTVYTRKHVSILYDNSGSMKSDRSLKWCYASYAAQVFTGLLNDTDTLSITFMAGDPLRNLDLAGPRQDAVSKVLNRTTDANADTPIEQIGPALSVLEEEGLKPGLGANSAGEQFWLVLTTDGIFRENNADLTVDRVAAEIEAVMERYPDLQVVYFGIGTQNGTSKDKPVDFRQGSDIDQKLLDSLHSHPNFTAVYAENQDQIVETMQALSNQISGRYSVQDAFDVSGDEVRLHLSGESSPIRNIAVMAQKTDARLVSATAEDETKLTVGREAEIRYPHNNNYNNVPDGTLGGYTALITGPKGTKVPNGNITLKFSEPVSPDELSLMYEPAIYIRLQVERKADGGRWEMVPQNANLVEGDEIRASYAICEDGTDKELDVGRLFGKSEATTLYNGEEIPDGKTITVSEGNSVLDVNVSMMDGGYQISTTRKLRVAKPGAGDFTVESSGPIELRRSAAAKNSDASVEFSVLFRGAPADRTYTSDIKMKVTGDAGELRGESEKPQDHVFRFTPRDDKCKAGTYTVSLFYKDAEIASEQIRILPNEDTFTAEAGPSISIMSNRVADNEDAVTFTVTAHRDEIDEPIKESEAALFQVQVDGKQAAGDVSYQSGGVIAYTMRDPHATSGNYGVSLWKGDEKLAETHITVVRYDATYTVEAVVSDPDAVDRYDLLNNRANVSFIVYEDGEPCKQGQLESMLGREITVTHDLDSKYAEIVPEVGEVNGKPAIVCRPASTTKSKFVYFFRKIAIAWTVWLKNGLNRDGIHVSLKVDMPHGDEGTGDLDLYGFEIVPFIVPIILTALLIIVWLFIFANLKANRLNKGIIWVFTVSRNQNANVFDANKIAGIKKKLGWGWKPMWLIPVDEAHIVKEVKFLAKSGKAGKGFKQKSTLFKFQRQHPTVEIKGTPAELENYYRADVNTEASRLLEDIKDASGGVPLENESGGALEKTDFFGPETKIWTNGGAESADSTSAEIHVTYKIQSNKAMIYRQDAGGENETFTVWVYEKKPDSTKKPTKKPAIKVLGKKKKSKK